MRICALIFITTALAGCATFTSFSSTGLVKVLPNYLDESGLHTDGVTLLHRDVHQKLLRKNPELVYGVRYDVNWYGSGEGTLRLELRSTKAGIAPMMLEETIASFVPGTCWTPLLLDEKSYQEFGQPQAWRVTIWKAGQERAQLKSFLW